MERAKGDIDDAKQRFTMAAKRYERDGQKPADRCKYLRNCQKQCATKQGGIGKQLVRLEKELSELSEDDAEGAKEEEIADLMQQTQVLLEEEKNISTQIEEESQQLSKLEQDAQEATAEIREFESSVESGGDEQLAKQEELTKLLRQLEKARTKAKEARNKVKESRVAQEDRRNLWEGAKKEVARLEKVARDYCEDEEVTPTFST